MAEPIVYNVLWIDDEHESLTSTKGRFRKANIVLHAFKSKSAGISELERNYKFYDGVLLDAKCFEYEDDVAGTEDTISSINAKERILQITKKFEVFVLTGQAEAFDDSTYKKVFTKIYRKGLDEDINRLINDLIVSAQALEDTQIRFKYHTAFEICTERYLGEAAGQDLLCLLKIGETLNIDDDFNRIRKILEDIFVCFNVYNLLPREFVTPNVALNESSKFLTGTNIKGVNFVEKGYTHKSETHLPKPIAQSLHNILTITQAGSHRSNIDTHIHLVQNNYLFKSTLYQLLDVLVWLKIYLDGNPLIENWTFDDSHINGVVPVSAARLKGMVKNIINSGAGFFKPDIGGNDIFIPASLITDHSLTVGMKIEATAENYVDHRSGDEKTRVKKVFI